MFNNVIAETVPEI